MVSSLPWCCRNNVCPGNYSFIKLMILATNPPIPASPNCAKIKKLIAIAANPSAVRVKGSTSSTMLTFTLRSSLSSGGSFDIFNGGETRASRRTVLALVTPGVATWKPFTVKRTLASRNRATIGLMIKQSKYTRESFYDTATATRKNPNPNQVAVLGVGGGLKLADPRPLSSVTPKRLSSVIGRALRVLQTFSRPYGRPRDRTLGSVESAVVVVGGKDLWTVTSFNQIPTKISMVIICTYETVHMNVEESSVLNRRSHSITSLASHHTHTQRGNVHQHHQSLVINAPPSANMVPSLTKSRNPVNRHQKHHYHECPHRNFQPDYYHHHAPPQVCGFSCRNVLCPLLGSRFQLSPEPSDLLEHPIDGSLEGHENGPRHVCPPTECHQARLFRLWLPKVRHHDAFENI